MVLLNLVLAGSYFLIAKFGLTLATLNNSVSPVWPATGFAFAAIYLAGCRVWPAILIGAFTANYFGGSDLIPAFSISVGNTIEALVGAMIILRLQKFRFHLGSQTETIAFVAAALAASAISATIGVGTLYLSGKFGPDLVGSVWGTWWIGDVLGGLVIAPALIHARRLQVFETDLRHLFGALLMAAASIWFVFVSPWGSAYVFLLFPVLLYATKKLNRSWVLLIAASICMACVSATVHGAGPFVAGTLNERLVHLQLFLAAIAITGISISGLAKADVTRVTSALLLASWALSGTIYLSFDRSERQQTDEHFADLRGDITDKIGAHMQSYKNTLRGGAGLIKASNQVTNKEWVSYIKSLDLATNHPGVTSTGALWNYEASQIPQLEAKMRAAGYPEFKVREVPFSDSSYSLKDPLHYIITLFQSDDTSKSALGLDLASETHRRLAANQSRDSGEATITAKVALIQDDKRTPGFILLLPVYREGMPVATTAERQRAHLAWVYTAVKYSNFLAEVFDASADEVELAVYDGHETLSDQKLFSNFSKPNDKSGEVRTSMQLAGREITILWRKSEHFITSHNTIVAWVGFCGAIASLLLANLMIGMQTLGRRSRELADGLTAELSASREKFAAGERRLLYALDGSNDGIWDWNILDKEMYVSGKIAATHGWRQKFKLEKPEDLSAFAHPDDIEVIRKSIRAVFDGTSDQHEVETRYKSVNGEWKWVLTRGKISERDTEGRPVRITGVHIDIHELKKAQSLLEHTQSNLRSVISDLKSAELTANRERHTAEEATKVKSQFLANMSHEIRTPLNGIIGMTNLLKKTQLDLQQADYTEVIGQSSDALLNIVNDVLDFSKAEAGKIDLEVVEFNLKSLITDVMRSLSFAARDKGLLIEVDAALPSGEYFKGDPGRIRQVLTNLLSNAIKFTPQGSVQLRLNSDGSHPISKLQFEIIDSGIGIPPESLSRMFQAFSQADASMTRRFGGTGLGLSISKQLVNLMDGKIGVESKVGEGTTFWFHLDLPRAVAPKKDKSLQPLQHTTLDARILVVEDNRINQRIALEMLQSLGYTPHAVGDGFEALDALRSARYDVVLMDCQMPEMDGYDTTKIIRKSTGFSFQTVPIIAMTANAMNGDREKCLAVGMNDYVSKPMSEYDLVKVVEKWIGHNGMTKPAGVAEPVKAAAHILVVEDHRINREIVCAMLKSLSYTFDTAENGRIALERLETNRYDLILMDCQMPEMDGYQATHALRRMDTDWAASIPVIALTANAMKGDREKCLESGMSDYLTKPVDEILLDKTLQKWLMRTQQSAKPAVAPISVPLPVQDPIIDESALAVLKSIQPKDQPNFVSNLINDYIATATASVVKIQASLGVLDLVALSKEAHSLKSSSASLGAVGLSKLCFELENLHDTGATASRIAELTTKVDLVYEETLKGFALFKKAA